MPPLSVMFKTVSSDCNLDCSYCYYRQSLGGVRVQRRLDVGLLERFLPGYMEYVADAHRANLNWQGGEPTLAGLDFFRTVVELEAKYASPPAVIDNAIQTNAVLLDDEWAEFFAEYRFLVGVSLDGPEDIHDVARKDRGGNGSYRRVMAGIEALRKRSVELNILCVVSPHNVHMAHDLMQFYRREGLTYLQFIPAMDFQSSEPFKPPSYLIDLGQYGELLVSLFDEWYGDGIPRVSIRIFDNFIQSLMGVVNDLCVHSGACDSGLVIECNGDTFPCDFYVHPEWRLGNVLQDSLRDMLESDVYRRFMRRREHPPDSCVQCVWKNLCKSECPRNWHVSTSGPGVSYFCQSYRMFFEHAVERLKTLAARLAAYRKYLAWQAAHKGISLAGDVACPCGSGLMFRQCCGNPAFGGSYLFQQ